MKTDLLTVRQAAAVRGVHPSRIRALIAQRRVKAMRFGSQWMIRRADLDRLVIGPVGRPARLLSSDSAPL